MAEPVLDLSTLSELERRLGRMRVTKVVAAQIANSQDMARRFSALEQAPDATQIKLLAHQIAGSSGSIGLARLSEQAFLVERTADTAGAVELVTLVRELRHCIDAALDALRAQYPDLAES